MNELNTGGPAFPLVREWAAGPWEHEAGMTLRDYFAAKAMAGFLATENFSNHYAAGIATAAYHMADAMLKARGEK